MEEVTTGQNTVEHVYTIQIQLKELLESTRFI